MQDPRGERRAHDDTQVEVKNAEADLDMNDAKQGGITNEGEKIQMSI